jgi:hypothetical protein
LRCSGASAKDAAQHEKTRKQAARVRIDDLP